MALEANNTWMREQPKTTEQHLYLTDSVQTQQRPPAKVLNKQLTQTERFTQTEYRSSCVELVALSTPKDSIMFEQQQHQSQPTPVQMYSTIDKKDISQEKGGNVSEFPFCYNVNMLQKVHHTQSGSPTATAVASIASDDKTCYRFDVAQPFGYNYTLVNQMSLAAATSSATFKCDVCGLVFNHVSLLNHHKRIHNGETNGSPDRSFSNEQTNEMKSHLKSQAKCRTCNRCGGQVIDCDHSNSNSKKKGSKYVKCENCQAGPTSTTTAITSNGSFHSSSPEPPDSPPEVLNISSKQLQLVKRHGQGMATVTKCHKCNGSGLIFIGGPRSPPSDKPYRCNICEGSFSRYSSLWSHKRLHSGDKPFKCDMCGLTFARAAYLKNHIRVHSGEKPYKCNVCGMQFSQSPHLKNHERIHSGERPYQCEICEKTFARHSTLWNHRRIHTGEKPYRCSVCGSAFNQATHLKNHAKVHTGEKPHRCDICEVGFSDRFALKRHKSIHDKYGKVSKNHTSSSSMEMLSKSSPQHLQDSQHQIGEMYKCDVAFPGQQPSSSSNSQHSQHSAQSDMFKCDASTSVAFGTNPNDTSQQQTELFKCDVGTSVSFPVQTQQASQSNSSTTQAQSAQMNEGTSNNMSYQNQQSSQKQNGASSLGQSETYKYDVSFTGQTQQDSSQSGQYDLAQQNQQKSTDAKTQQLPQSTLKTLYTNEHSDAILGP